MDKNNSKPDKHCNTCGAMNLHWEQDVHGWRLFTPEGVMHKCYAEKNEREKLTAKSWKNSKRKD